MLAHHKEHGWPSNEHVYDKENRQTKVTSKHNIPFGLASNLRLWGVGARPHNVFLPTGGVAQQVAVVEKGLMNTIEGLGKPAADVGDVMLVVDGPTLQDPSSHMRFVMLVTGVCYSPKVFDVVMCEFEDNSRTTEPDLQVPAVCRNSRRHCRLSRFFEAINAKTSTEIAFDLTQSLAVMRLSIAAYEVLDKDGTLVWSRITIVRAIGSLWAPGRQDLLGKAKAKAKAKADAHRRAERIFESMLGGDPFAEVPPVAKASAPRSSRPSATRGSKSGATDVGLGGNTRGQASGHFGKQRDDKQPSAGDGLPSVADAPAPLPPQPAGLDPPTEVDAEDMDMVSLEHDLAAIWADDFEHGLGDVEDEEEEQTPATLASLAGDCADLDGQGAVSAPDDTIAAEIAAAALEAVDLLGGGEDEEGPSASVEQPPAAASASSAALVNPWDLCTAPSP